MVEDRIRELGLEYTFLRPNLFLQGLLAMAGSIAHEGRFFAPIGDARVSAIDVRDIAAVAVAALIEDEHADAAYTLTGPAAVTHAEMAAALSAVLERDIAFIDTPPDDFAKFLQGILPPWQIEGLLEDYAHYSRGEAAEISTAVTDVSFRPARDLRRFAEDYAPAFA